MGATAGIRLLVHAVEAGSSRMLFFRIMRLTVSGSGRNGCRPFAWSKQQGSQALFGDRAIDGSKVQVTQHETSVVLHNIIEFQEVKDRVARPVWWLTRYPVCNVEMTFQTLDSCGSCVTGSRTRSSRWSGHAICN